MAASESMGTAQCNDLLVIETHASEDGTQVVVAPATIWETSVRCAGRHILIESARSVGDGWPLHFLDTDDTAEDPEIGVGDPWELLCS